MFDKADEKGRLFIRPCFQPLTELIMQKRQAYLQSLKHPKEWNEQSIEAKKGLILAGNSGVGKVSPQQPTPHASSAPRLHRLTVHFSMFCCASSRSLRSI